MARFNFGKRSHHDDEGIPPEPLEGDTGGEFERETIERGSRVRRPLMIAAIGIVAVGGLYLANVLFFSAPPAPPTPVRAVVPVPSVPPAAPVAPAPTKEATGGCVGAAGEAGSTGNERRSQEPASRGALEGGGAGQGGYAALQAGGQDRHKRAVPGQDDHPTGFTAKAGGARSESGGEGAGESRSAGIHGF
ncbi:MAG: hypothetical protein EHM71_03655 [Zetaproteobacteria bacterium]|nr:MAG: hypothetical protein EHM71_03655 [Zetaproteobacteria bacterium]